MRFASPGSFRLPTLVTGLIGAASIAAVTVVDRGSSWMHAWPGTLFYWCALLAPPAGLLLRVLTDPPLQLPAKRWLALAGVATPVVLASALASPWRPTVLAWSIAPLSALALFLLVHDWLRTAPANAGALETAGAALAGGLMLASTAYWVIDLYQSIAVRHAASTVFEMRNPHPLGHSNYTAGLALLSLPLLGHLAWRRRNARRGFFLAGFALAVLVLFASGSRGGLLGLAALGLAALAHAQLGWRKFLLGATATLIAVVALAVANPRVRALVTPPDTTAAPNPSTIQRTAMLTAGWRMGADRPVLGWGLHATPLVYPRYRAGLDGGAEDVLQLHNTPVELWAGLGAPGVLLWAAFVLLVALDFRRDAIAATALAGYGVFALTDYQLDVPAFAFGVAIFAARLARPGSQPASSAIRMAIAGTIVGAVALVGALGRRDPTPAMNVEALRLGGDDTRAKEAVALLHDSLALNADQEIAHFNLGWLLVVRDPAAAETHFRAAARLVPDKGGVYFGLGLARLNQGRKDAAAELFALECVNDPLFLNSPWWLEPAIAAAAEPARAAFTRQLAAIAAGLAPDSWAARQAGLLATLAPRLGQVPPGREKVYRRERIGYPVLMRNHDIAPPQDLFVVRESPDFPATVDFPLPPKGWLPSPLLLKRLDAIAGSPQ